MGASAYSMMVNIEAKNSKPSGNRLYGAFNVSGCKGVPELASSLGSLRTCYSTGKEFIWRLYSIYEMG